MTALLWTLVALGVWNGVSLIVRVQSGYDDPLRYAWSVIFGIWAAILLYSQ